MTNAPIPPPTPSGFWSLDTGSEFRIGARHRSPRSVGACMCVLIWSMLALDAGSSCAKGLNAFNTVKTAFIIWIGVFILREALTSLFGRTEIRIRARAAEVIEGFGPLSTRTPFDPFSITAVTEYITDEQTDRRCVQLESSSPVYFGGHWSDQRRLAVIQALQAALSAPYKQPLPIVERERQASQAAAESATALGPKGTWTIAEGTTLRLGARCRMWEVIPFAAFACFWNGTIITMAVASIRAGQYWPLLFLMLFAAFGLLITWPVLQSLLGRVEITFSGDEAKVFTGIGRFGSTQQFQPSRVTGIRQHYQRGRRGGTTVSLIIEAGDEVMLGGMLTTHRREWLRATLAARLLVPATSQQKEGS